MMFLYLFLALFSGFWLFSQVKFPGTLMDYVLTKKEKKKTINSVQDKFDLIKGSSWNNPYYRQFAAWS